MRAAGTLPRKCIIVFANRTRYTRAHSLPSRGVAWGEMIPGTILKIQGSAAMAVVVRRSFLPTLLVMFAGPMLRIRSLPCGTEFGQNSASGPQFRRLFLGYKLASGRANATNGLRNSLFGADIAEHIQLLLVFSAHILFLLVHAVETRECRGTEEHSMDHTPGRNNEFNLFRSGHRLDTRTERMKPNNRWPRHGMDCE